MYKVQVKTNKPWFFKNNWIEGRWTVISQAETRKQVEEIANQKMVDLNANDLDAACKIIEGTARSMGIEVG